jgi:hypothetical protein
VELPGELMGVMGSMTTFSFPSSAEHELKLGSCLPGIKAAAVSILLFLHPEVSAVGLVLSGEEVLRITKGKGTQAERQEAAETIFIFHLIVQVFIY